MVHFVLVDDTENSNTLHRLRIISDQIRLVHCLQTRKPLSQANGLVFLAQ